MGEAPLNSQVVDPDEFEGDKAIASLHPAGAEDVAGVSGTGGPFIPLEPGAPPQDLRKPSISPPPISSNRLSPSHAPALRQDKPNPARRPPLWTQ